MLDKSPYAYADAIVMLTWSNWFTELRSNRYHYATRFAEIMPVIFVQPDLKKPEYIFEDTGIENLIVLHIYNKYGSEQTALLNQALLEKNRLKPIFWIYNCLFNQYLANRYSILNIYHGTEDYLSSVSRIQFKDNLLIESYKDTLTHCHAIITVSDGVKESFESNVNFEGLIKTVANGCDYKFYSPALNNGPLIPAQNSKIVYYQGNIFDKLDYDLLIALTQQMPDWTFQFCGKVLFNEPGWQKLIKQKNVQYLGLLTPEELRARSYEATVGIIPFVHSEWLIDRSFPLKTFEYLACGLPVVSNPIKSILNFANVIQFANTVEEFKQGIIAAQKQRYDVEHTKLRLETAALQDYDIRFKEVQKFIEKNVLQQQQKKPLKIAVLYETSSVVVNTIQEHLNSFNLYSNNHIVYLPATQNIKSSINLNAFDAIVIHYSVRMTVLEGNLMLSPDYIELIKNYSGYKILFLQDEYEGTNIAKDWIKKLGVHLVYTCVPDQYRERVYPTAEFPSVGFVHTLTGYIPIIKNQTIQPSRPSSRSLLIGYRGRSLPFWYGSLGQEKLNIGIKVKEYCVSKNLPIDIEWEESKRIYGKNWYAFLSSSRATLGTESGSNIFDFDGQIRIKLQELMRQNPELTYDSIFEEYIKPNETFPMNQVSPKIFESILFRTALVLFEGEYSGVLKAHIHYIVLKKDFSNLEEVLSKIQDNDFIDQMTEQAYRDVIESNEYSYQTFIKEFDRELGLRLNQKIKMHKLLEFYNFCNINKTNTRLLHYNFNPLQPSNFILTLEQIKEIETDFELKLIDELFSLDNIALAFKVKILDKFKHRSITLAKSVIPESIKQKLKKLLKPETV